MDLFFALMYCIIFFWFGGCSSQDSLASTCSVSSSLDEEDALLSAQVSSAASSVVTATSSATAAQRLSNALQQHKWRVYDPFLVSCRTAAMKTSLGLPNNTLNSNLGHNSMRQNKFTLNPSVLGESLDTSLGSLRIGSATKKGSVPSARDAFIQRSADMNGIVLDSIEVEYTC